MSVPEVPHYQAEMGFSREELLRELPNAVVPFCLTVESAGVVKMNFNECSATLKIENDRFRHLGSLVLPVVDVSISFENFTEQQYTAFIERFRIRLQRGGG